MDVTFTKAPDGRKLLEVVHEDLDISVDALVEVAMSNDARLVWIHGGEHGVSGFTRRQGFARLHLEQSRVLDVGILVGEVVDEASRVRLMNDAFLGVWGHHAYDPAEDPNIDSGETIGIRVDDGFIGICTLWRDQRLIDGPGVMEEYRNAERKRQLLSLACLALGEGPVDVETWGEDEDACAQYQSMGFELVTNEVGWELAL